MIKEKLIILYFFVLAIANGYSQCVVPSMIPNSNFENPNPCPGGLNEQIANAAPWQETSDFPADYFNCGFANIPATYNAPPPSASGTGYIGLSNHSSGHKTYASTCLLNPLTAGQNYTYQFDIATAQGLSGSIYNGLNSNPNFTMVLYGSTICPVAPFAGNSCPTAADGWVPIVTINVVANGLTWTNASATFIAAANYTSVAIGPDCNVASNATGLCAYPGLCNNYYYLDNFGLNLTNLYPTVTANADLTNNCITPTNNLDANISGGTANFSYEWTPVTGLSDATIQNPVANPVATTNYTVKITDANGCTDTDIVKVTVDKTPPVANAGLDKTISCIKPTVVITASGGGTYSWSPGAGLSSTTASNPTSSAIITTVYEVTVMGANGCTDTDQVTVNVDKDIPVVTTGPDVATTCAIPDAQLSASSTTLGVTYKWTPNFALSNPNIANPTARPPSTTVYTVTAKAPNGCEKTATTTVTINDPTPIAEAGATKNLCSLNNTNFNPNLSTALPIDTYLWEASANNPTAAVFSDNTLPNSNVSNLIEGIYKFYFTVSNNVCPAVKDSMLINVYNAPIAQAGNDDSLCSIYNTQLNALPPVGTAKGKWSLQGNFPNPIGSIFSNVNIPNSNVSNLQEGVYHFVWTATNGTCPAARDTVAISVFNNPIANAGIDINLCALYTVNLSATAGIGTAKGKWTNTIDNPTIATFANDAAPNSNISGLIEGVYEFVWTVSNGNCTDDIDTVVVSVFDAPISNAGIATSVCGYDTLNLDTLYFLNANVPAGTATGIWTIDQTVANPSTPIFIDDTSQVAGVTNLLEGNYQFVWTVSNGSCPDASSSVLVSAFDKPLAYGGADQEFCATYILSLDATPTNGTSVGAWGVASNWTNPSVVVIDDVNDPISSSSGYIEGVYKFVWTVINGNCNPIYDTVVFTIYDAPNANAGADIEMCALSDTSLNGIDPAGTASGVWSQDFSFNSSTAINFADDTLNNTNSINYIEGTYRLIWTVSTGNCTDDKDSILVSTYNTPIASAGFDQSICDLDSVMLNGSGNIGTATGEWFLDYNYPYPSIPIYRDSSLRNTVAENLMVGDYAMIWVVENGVCPSDTDTVIIHNLERPVARAVYETEQCDNKCFKVTSFSTAPIGDGLSLEWTINNQIYNDSVPEICINVADDYIVKLKITSSNSCVDSLINAPLITVNPSPFADFVLNYETDSLIELQRVDVEDLSSSDVIYYWYSMGNGDTIVDEADFIYFYNNFGNYKLEQWVENQFGCRDSIDVTQNVIKRRTVFVPNTFTPNNDGINDVFIPITRAISDYEYEFLIFDRWGTMIFRTTSPDIGWDGTYKGDVVKDDAYIWKLKYTYETSPEIIEEQGHVMIYKYSR